MGGGLPKGAGMPRADSAPSSENSFTGYQRPEKVLHFPCHNHPHPRPLLEQLWTPRLELQRGSSSAFASSCARPCLASHMMHSLLCT